MPRLRRSRFGLTLACLTLLPLAAAAALAVGAGPDASKSARAEAKATPDAGTPADSVVLPRHRPDDPWGADGLLTPRALVRLLDSKEKNPPFLLHVGFGILYRGGHIPGSVYAGPGAKLDGVKAMREALAKVPKDRMVVLYCGCCPWHECPNVRPAYRAAEKLGFKQVRVLYLPRSLQQDWIDHGYGVERSK
ncbi:MAG: rhodanese-like domain-containing protein [Hyphomicrobiales bacterium]